MYSWSSKNFTYLAEDHIADQLVAKIYMLIMHIPEEIN